MQRQIERPLHSRTVLILEQDAQSCDLVSATLAREFGVSVVCTTESLEALDIARRTRPDLVLLDLSRATSPESAELTHFRAELAATSIPVVTLNAATWASAEKFHAEAAAIGSEVRDDDMAMFLSTVSEHLRAPLETAASTTMEDSSLPTI